MISYQRHGHRMIGTVGRVRRAHLGALGASSTDSFFQGGTTTGGPLPGQSSGEFMSPPPPVSPKVVALHFATPMPTVPAFTPAPPATAALTDSSSTNTRPPCECARSAVAAAIAGGAGVGLLMWLAGLLTREHKRRRRR